MSNQNRSIFLLVFASITTTHAFASEGLLRIATQPTGATILIDGKRKGESPSVGGAYFQISLSEGDYELTLVDQTSGNMVKKNVYVADDTVQPLDIRITPQKISPPQPTIKFSTKPEQNLQSENKIKIEEVTVLSPPNPNDGLPLNVQEVLSGDGGLRLESQVIYSTRETESADSLFELIQTGDGQFVSVPVTVGTLRQNSDTVVASLTGRYGLNKNAELVLRGSMVANDTRTVDSTERSFSSNNQQFNSLAVGLNYRFSDDDKTPAFLGFAEVNVLENTANQGHDFTSGRTGVLGFTAYRVLDPLVISLTGGYRLALERDVDGNSINPGDSIFINPSIGFAVNSDVTLTGGVDVRLQGKDKINGVTRGVRNTRVDLQFGAGYSASDALTLRFDTKANISGSGGAELGLTAIYDAL